jgi:N-methylhydantoinase B/oxoprolinase/acetone carboxylase alpha subunit
MAGGGAGAPGQNCIVRDGGQMEILGAVGQAEMAVGDVFIIITPGGGACGGVSVAGLSALRARYAPDYVRQRTDMLPRPL